MALAQNTIEEKLKAAFPEAQIDLKDPLGDQNHYQLRIVAKEFENKTRIARHQLIYKALGAVVGEELHALSIKAFTPEELKIEDTKAEN